MVGLLEFSRVLSRSSHRRRMYLQCMIGRIPRDHRGVGCAVFSGDSTDHALEVHAPAVEALARNIRRLADYCPVLMLHGTFSHEPPGYRGAEYEVTLVPKVKIEAAIPDNLLDKVIEALGRAAKPA